VSCQLRVTLGCAGCFLGRRRGCEQINLRFTLCTVTLLGRAGHTLCPRWRPRQYLRDSPPVVNCSVTSSNQKAKPCKFEQQGQVPLMWRSNARDSGGRAAGQVAVRE
jgi:hypothetical protein